LVDQFQAVNVLRDPRTKLAISAVSQAISLATAKTLLLRVLDVVVDSNLVVDPRSATRYAEQEIICRYSC
jgi:hypothetical protein